ncbi:VOC family protein [Streptomyces sp. RFCAC02]|uniref:VOC family protein n=1 Tax=Streptomyces sp. RFCAC02 TaxID=2499143 RepID=UPI001022961F|nr:VOC family protein [Streptomyces sp. RFCAC02]
MPGGVPFIELGVADVSRARTFYAGLFGWSFVPGPGGDGLIVSGMGVPGGLHGGEAGAAPVVFFPVDDMDAALTKVADLGGSVESSAMDGDPGSQSRFGRFVLCRDDQGSPFGLHQPPM